MTILHGARPDWLVAWSSNQLGQQRAAGLELLAGYRDGSERQGNSQWLMRFDIIESAKETARLEISREQS